MIRPNRPSVIDEIMIAAECCHRRGPSWVEFYRQFVAAEGMVRSRLSDFEFESFAESEQYAELLEMLADLRSRDSRKPSTIEPEQMITIRLPASVHRALSMEAQESRISLNKLAISKLIQPIDARFVPIQRGKVKGRKLAAGSEA